MIDLLKQIVIFLRSFGLNYVFFLIIILFITLLIFPFLDSSIYRFHRLEYKVDILSKLAKIDKKTISADPRLKVSYEKLLDEMDEY